MEIDALIQKVVGIKIDWLDRATFAYSVHKKCYCRMTGI